MNNSFSQINKILDFYKSLPNEVAVCSDLFSEGDSENMIWNRLECAAKDEAENNLIHSR